MRYDKLVRDLIPDRIRAKGEPCSFHTADDEEYREKLLEKLAEEVTEFREAEDIEELADLLEVIDALIAYKGFDRDELAQVKAKKLAERGSFEKRIILEES